MTRNIDYFKASEKWGARQVNKQKQTKKSKIAIAILIESSKLVKLMYYSRITI